MLSIFINTLLAIHVLISLLIILLVLMQRPKNEGLGAAFGGGMTENLFGAQTTNVLQTITRWMGGIFFALTLTLSWLYVKQTGKGDRGSVQQRLMAIPSPSSKPAPATPTPGVASPAPEKAPAVPAPATPLEQPDVPPARPSAAVPEAPSTNEAPAPSAPVAAPAQPETPKPASDAAQ